MDKRQFLCAGLTFSLLFLHASTHTWADDLEDQLQDIQGQIDESRNEQASWQEIIEQVSVQLKAIQAELDAANARLTAIQKEQAETNRKIQETVAAIQEAQNRLQLRQRILNQRVRSIYIHGQLSYLEVIVGSKSFSDFANRLELLRRIIHSDYDLILEIQNQKAQIEQKKVQLDQEKARLDALAEEAQKEQDTIAQKKAEQQKVLDQAKGHKAAAEQMEQDLIERSNQVQALIQERMRQRENSSSGDDSYTQGSGVMSWPCNGVITSPYGYRVHPIFGTTIYHSGMDIGVDYGTPIHAADSGTVIYSGWISGYGNAVIIDHGNGVQTLYGHNQSLNVSEGESVSKGSVIAYAGSTGNSTGPHCHFEVRVNGEPADPMAYL